MKSFFLYGPGLALSDINLGILYMLAVSSLSTYGILLAGLVQYTWNKSKKLLNMNIPLMLFDRSPL